MFKIEGRSHMGKTGAHVAVSVIGFSIFSINALCVKDYPMLGG